MPDTSKDSMPQQDETDYLEMTPQEFLAFWKCERQTYAQAIGVSLSTVNGWFTSPNSRRHRTPDNVVLRCTAEVHQRWLREGRKP